MKRSYFLATIASMVVAFSQEPPPIARSPKVEFKGRIEKVQIARGEGTPYLDVRTDRGIEKVALGSVRFLVEQDFNPKAGEEVAVKGYRTAGSVIAISVKLLSGGKELRLRDDEGRPVWMRGRRMGRGPR